MQVENTLIKDLVLLTPNVYTDKRGYFLETYNQNTYAKYIKVKFVQDNESLSAKGVVRGLHFQKPPFAQAKLVRVVRGSVLDIAVDIRTSSPTYGQHVKLLLSAENKKQLYIPEGFAHGFVALEDDTIFSYKCSNLYHAASEASLLWNDPDLAIDWEVAASILAEKDAEAEKFATFKSPFL